MIIGVLELEKVVGETKQQRIASNEGRRLDGRVHRTEGYSCSHYQVVHALSRILYTNPCQLLLYLFPFPISTKNGPIAVILRGCLRVVEISRRS